MDNSAGFVRKSRALQRISTKQSFQFLLDVWTLPHHVKISLDMFVVSQRDNL
jgi:hypothetical protein